MSNPTVKDTIVSLELALLKPEVRRSAEKLDALLADDFLEFGMFGMKYSKKDIIERLPHADEEHYERYSASDFETREISTEIVILTYRATTEFQKTQEIIPTLRCSIWQKKGDTWQMIFHQGTVVR
jgi:hypothetical protein